MLEAQQRQHCCQHKEQTNREEREIEQQASCAVGSRQRKQDKRSDIEREHNEREKKKLQKLEDTIVEKMLASLKDQG